MGEMRPAAGWSMAVAGLLVGCLEVPPMPPVAEETTHFRYRVGEGLPLCPAAIEWTEHHYETVAPWFGVELPPGERFDYSYLHQEEIDETCGLGASGCAMEGYAFASRPFHGHELVHLYAHLLGRPPALFREGIAEVLGAGWTDDRHPMQRSTRVLELLEEEPFRAHPDMHEAYRLAAGFVRFLIERHGRRPFLDLYATLPWGASAQTIDQAFEGLFGETAGQVVERWLAARPATPAQVAIHLAECASAPFDVSALHGKPMGCGLGRDLETAVRIRTLEVDPPGSVAMEIPVDRSLQIEIFSCRTGQRSASTTGPVATPFAPHLAPGRYWIRLSDGPPMLSERRPSSRPSPLPSRAAR